MSKYTTGEIAKLCGVSVRTVQYYDERGILIPSELSEGGRRLYSEDDYKKLKIICFLRDAGISIKSIGETSSERVYFFKSFHDAQKTDVYQLWISWFLC